GCTFYFLLTGQPPFPSSSLAGKLLRHQQEEPPAVDHVRPDVPPALAGILRRMLAKRPDERYATPAGVVAALTEAGYAGTSPEPAKVPAPVVAVSAVPEPAPLSPAAAPPSFAFRETAPVVPRRRPGWRPWLAAGGPVLLIALMGGFIS